MSDLRISMAFELYDRTMPFVDGSVKPVGTEPQMLAIYEGTRHPRMLDNLEFDVCELSISYYLRAKSQGLPITAIPVFPRRLFGHAMIAKRPPSPRAAYPEAIQGMDGSGQELQPSSANVAGPEPAIDARG